MSSAAQNFCSKNLQFLFKLQSCSLDLPYLVSLVSFLNDGVCSLVQV